MEGFAALYIFMLAAFTGYEIIGRVPTILHTPLMSGSNFIHVEVIANAPLFKEYLLNLNVGCLRRN